jgi:Dak1 domain
MCSISVSPRSNTLHNTLPRQTKSGSLSSAMTLPSARLRGVSLDAGSAFQRTFCMVFHFIRGLAGTVLVYKIAGALAQTGASLEEVYTVAEWISQNIATVGVGLEHCHVSSNSPRVRRYRSLQINFPGTWDCRGRSASNLLRNRDRNGHTQ